MFRLIVTNDEEVIRFARERGAGVFTTEKFPESVERVVVEGENETKLSNVIYDLFRKLNIKPNVKGYHYLKCLMEMCEQDPTYHARPITKEIYPDCAKKFGTTASRVERAIRHAIEGSFDSVPEKYSEIFGGEFPKEPTNSEFIGLVSEYIARHK